MIEHLARDVAIQPAFETTALRDTDDEEVAAFVEAGNIVHGTVVKQEEGLACLDVGDRELQVVTDLTVNTRVTAYLHYDDVTISLPTEAPSPTSARNQIKGKITRAVAFGSQVKVVLDCGFGLASVITRRSYQELGLEVGREVVASFKASAVHLIPRNQPATG